MDGYTLVIGNKAYSSWSMRPWLLMKQKDIPFEEVRIPLFTEGAKQQLLHHSGAAKVPVLRHGSLTVWDSLAICEYLAERHPDRGLWPQDVAARAHARSTSAEMHSGFGDLRNHMPMNVRRRIAKSRTPAVDADIARIQAIWKECRERFGQGGPYLYGQFCIADTMYAPVVTRFQTYGVETTGPAGDYARAILQTPALRAWIEAAHAETEVVDRYEA